MRLPQSLASITCEKLGRWEGLGVWLHLQVVNLSFQDNREPVSCLQIYVVDSTKCLQTLVS